MANSIVGVDGVGQRRNCASLGGRRGIHPRRRRFASGAMIYVSLHELLPMARELEIAIFVAGSGAGDGTWISRIPSL